MGGMEGGRKAELRDDECVFSFSQKSLLSAQMGLEQSAPAALTPPQTGGHSNSHSFLAVLGLGLFSTYRHCGVSTSACEVGIQRVLSQYDHQ